MKHVLIRSQAVRWPTVRKEWRSAGMEVTYCQPPNGLRQNDDILKLRPKQKSKVRTTRIHVRLDATVNLAK